MTLPEPLDLRADDGARARLQPQGGQVLDWTPAGETRSRLYLSGRAVYAPGSAIRGGVPVIFPQFAGEGPLPKHGFARTARWTVQRHECIGAQAQAECVLRADDATRALWPQDFELRLVVTVGGPTLSLALSVHNTGSTPLRFTAALHTYLAVDDLDHAELHGLKGLRYRDSATGGTPGLESDATRHIRGEVDRIYFDAPPALDLVDGARRMRIEQQGFADTVVWNPGPAKAAALTDLDQPDGWRQMLCVEAAVVGQPVPLAPGSQWLGRQRLTAV
jgi:glucose-6-phosphate 1-epimerase